MRIINRLLGESIFIGEHTHVRVLDNRRLVCKSNESISRTETGRTHRVSDNWVSLKRKAGQSITIGDSIVTVLKRGQLGVILQVETQDLVELGENVCPRCKLLSEEARKQRLKFTKEGIRTCSQGLITWSELR